MSAPPSSEAALALWLADHAAATGHLTFIAQDESRLERLVRACTGFCLGRVECLVLPPWDVLPYDRISPSAAIVGQRIETMHRLIKATGPRLCLTTAEAVLQRVPASTTWATAALTLAVGDTLDVEWLRAELGLRGYHLGETVSDPGEVAFRQHVIDVFPAGAAIPARIGVEDGKIAALHCFDQATQRNETELDRLTLFPAIEFPLDPDEVEQTLEGDETPLVLPSGKLVPIFDYLKGDAYMLDEGVQERWSEFREQADDAYEASRRWRRTEVARGMLPRPDRFYLSATAAMQAVADRQVELPAPAAEPTARSLRELVDRARQACVPVIIAAPIDPEAVARSLSRRGVEVRAAVDWNGAKAGGICCYTLDIDTGFSNEGVLVLQAAPFVRLPTGSAEAPQLGLEADLRTGDLVVHLERGAARLAGLKQVEMDGQIEERVALAFADEVELLVPPTDLDRIWRYGTEGTRDRLGGESWADKRHEIERELDSTAAALAEAADRRKARKAPAIDGDRAGYDRLARRFPYALSTDQRSAIDAVLADMTRGSPPMDRLVCGDVGFGKTEVALRAAAAVALSGHQVAIAAPTSVLARQHLETFRRRFAGSGIQIESLMGPASDPRRRDTRRGLADGSIRIVVGTQALASDTVRYARLGLVIIDEEQRFGEDHKRALTEAGADAVHTLVMTATPIPRTMQSALIGLRDVSVIARAPRRRQPTRTIVVPFDPVVVREALLRERERGGQSFVVCPRIADLAAMAGTLKELVPELAIVQAHGRMKAEALEAAVVDFSDGEGDVLLATNIIEAGLDVPRANTILVMHADRFGLAQLHQIRGRVGRGGRRGMAYMMTDPGRRLTTATMARLRTLETLSSLGAGVAISTADLDQRGAGDLFGIAQTGHVSALGTELFQHLLLRAIKLRQGEPVSPPRPELNVGWEGRLPDDLVPEPDLRLSLYRRVARMSDAADVRAFAEEFDDRFGALPSAVEVLLANARLRCMAHTLRLASVEAGPRGAALVPCDTADLPALAAHTGGIVRDGRVFLDLQAASTQGRVTQLIERLAAPPREVCRRDVA